MKKEGNRKLRKKSKVLAESIFLEAEKILEDESYLEEELPSFQPEMLEVEKTPEVVNQETRNKVESSQPMSLSTDEIMGVEEVVETTPMIKSEKKAVSKREKTLKQTQKSKRKTDTKSLEPIQEENNIPLEKMENLNEPKEEKPVKRPKRKPSRKREISLIESEPVMEEPSIVTEQQEIEKDLANPSEIEVQPVESVLQETKPAKKEKKATKRTKKSKKESETIQSEMIPELVDVSFESKIEKPNLEPIETNFEVVVPDVVVEKPVIKPKKDTKKGKKVQKEAPILVPEETVPLEVTLEEQVTPSLSITTEKKEKKKVSKRSKKESKPALHEEPIEVEPSSSLTETIEQNSVEEPIMESLPKEAKKKVSKHSKKKAKSISTLEENKPEEEMISSPIQEKKENPSLEESLETDTLKLVPEEETRVEPMEMVEQKKPAKSKKKKKKERVPKENKEPSFQEETVLALEESKEAKPETTTSFSFSKLLERVEEGLQNLEREEREKEQQLKQAEQSVPIISKKPVEEEIELLEVPEEPKTVVEIVKDSQSIELPQEEEIEILEIEEEPGVETTKEVQEPETLPEMPLSHEKSEVTSMNEDVKVPILPKKMERKEKKHYITWIFLVLLLLFVIFLPQISEWIKNGTKEEIFTSSSKPKKTGYYHCTVEKPLDDGMYQVAMNIYYVNNLLTKITGRQVTTLTSAPVVTNINALQLSCLSYQVAMGEYGSVNCIVQENSQTPEAVYDYSKLDVTKVGKNLVEMNGMYLDYRPKTEISKVVNDFRKGGYSCRSMK